MHVSLTNIHTRLDVIEQQSAELRQHLDTAFVRDENVRERRVAMNG